MIIAPLPGSGLLQQFGRFGIRRNAIFDIRLVAQAAQPDVVFLGGLARADGGARARALLLVGDVAFAAVQQLRHMPAELRAERLGDLVRLQLVETRLEFRDEHAWRLEAENTAADRKSTRLNSSH